MGQKNDIINFDYEIDLAKAAIINLNYIVKMVFGFTLHDIYLGSTVGKLGIQI